MPGQSLSSLFTTWWKNGQDFLEMVPLAASMEAPVTSLGSVELENLTLEEKGLGDI